MNLQNILQKARLKLEHHPYGNLLLMLANPFYARPHHFWNAQNSIAGRIGKFSLLVPALLFYKFSHAITEEIIQYYAAKQAITAPMIAAFETAGDTVAWYLVLGMVVVICTIAGVAFGFNKLACRVCEKFGRKVNSAPYDFYLARYASWASWLGILMFAALYGYNFGLELAMVQAKEFIANHPTVVVFLLVGCVVMNEIGRSNSFSSSMEIYGAKSIIFIKNIFATVLLVGIMYLLPPLFKMVQFSQ